MTISCDCSTTDYDAPWCYSSKIRTARKEHTCVECSDTIAPGQRYEYVSGVWDGRPESYHTCLTCIAIRKRYCPSGWLIGELRQTIYNCLGFDYTEVPGADNEDESEAIDDEDAANVAWHRARQEAGK